MKENKDNDEILSEFEVIDNKKMKDNTENKENIIYIDINNLKEHEENKNILPPLDDLQKNMLLENIKENGFIEPIHITTRAVKEDKRFKQIVLDGNNRIFEIVLKHPELKISKVPAIEIDIDPEMEKDYIFKRNSGRRQITKLSMSYIIGNLYNTTKDTHGGKRSSSGQNDQMPKTTAELLSERFNLGARTIRRYGTFAKHCKEISEATSNTFLFFLLNTVKSSQKEITDLSKMPIEKIKQVFEIYEKSDDIEPEPLKTVLKQINKGKEKKVKEKILTLKIDEKKYSKIERKAKEQNVSVDELLNKLLDEL